MAIKSKSRIAAGSTHFPVLEKRAPGDLESDAKIKSHSEPQDLLIDPAGADELGSTHTPIQASADDLDEDLGIESLDEIQADLDDVEEDETLDSILDDAEEAETDEVLESDFNDDVVEELDDMGLPEEDQVEASIEEEVFEAEGVPLVDIDAVADEVECPEQELAVAALGSTIHVLRSNRIIASMTKKQAVSASKEDIYLEESFPSVIFAEVQEKGLRRGLVDMGFGLSKVKFESSTAVKAAVDQKLAKAKIQASKSVEKDRQAFTQSLAIASVGLNRRFFKDVRNELKAGLEEELQAMGVRGASKIVASMFAKHGISYANALVTLATKLSAMPEETRDQFAEALDLTEDAEVEDDEIIESEAEFDPDEDFEEEIPSSITAACAKPLRSVGVRATRTGSPSVQDVLSGAQPLPFLF